MHGDINVVRPITDHSPIIQNTAWGAVATMTMLSPGSPYTPPAQVGGVNSLPANGQMQMEAMAQYIVAMFKQGIGFLTLQEVPDKDSAHFKMLLTKLKELVGTSNLIDVDALETQWLKTGTHSFGTSILYNPSRFSITQNAKSALKKRAAEYELTDLKTNTKIPVANIHGEYGQQQATAEYIARFQGLCLGGTNLSSFTKTINPLIYQTAEQPVLLIDGRTYRINTFDLIQDNYSKRINPHFVLNTSGIEKPTIKKETAFTPQEITIALQDAKAYLDDFANYLIQMVKCIWCRKDELKALH